MVSETTAHRLNQMSITKHFPSRYGLGLLIAFTAALTYGALTTDFFKWDLIITEWLQGFHPAALEPILHYNNRMGVVGISGVTGVAVMAWLWFKGWRAEAFFVGCVGITDLLNPILRYFIGRPRPNPGIIDVYRSPDDFTFPSGTAMHVFMFCGILVYLAQSLIKPGYLKTTFQALVIVYIPLMGLWIIYRGVHWPSDVIGGFAYGAIFLWIIIWGRRKYVTWRRRYPKDNISREDLPPLMRPFAWVVRLIY